ncbi:hypothetical protein ACVXG7_14400 [Enterobacter hormaechei]
MRELLLNNQDSNLISWSTARMLKKPTKTLILSDKNEGLLNAALFAFLNRQVFYE